MRVCPPILILVSGMSLVGCGAGYSNGFAAAHGEGQGMPAKTIEEALKAHTDHLMAISGVVGVGQGLLDNTPCIKVLVVEKTPELQRQIPEFLDGHPVVVQQSGVIKALPKARGP